MEKKFYSEEQFMVKTRGDGVIRYWIQFLRMGVMC